MTGPKGSIAPEFSGLGARKPRKDEIKPKPMPQPAPGHEKDWSIVIGTDGKWETCIEGNGAEPAKNPADWPFGDPIWVIKP